RTICPSCPVKTTGGAPDQQPVEIWDAAGANPLAAGGSLQNTAGTTSYLAVAKAFSEFDPSDDGFLDYQPFTVSASPFTINPVGNGLKVDTPVQFTSRPGPLAVAGSTYTWTVTDGNPPTIVQGGSTFT